MLNNYIKYKYDFSDYILLLKSGNFYVCLNNDAYIISNIMNYKIVSLKQFIKCGFPLSSLNKVIFNLNELNVNYLIIDKEIILKEKFNTNNYNKYLGQNNYLIRINQIDRINNILKNNITNNKIDEILKQLEDIICKINF